MGEHQVGWEDAGTLPRARRCVGRALLSVLTSSARPLRGSHADRAERGVAMLQHPVSTVVVQPALAAAVVLILTRRPSRPTSPSPETRRADHRLSTKKARSLSAHSSARDAARRSCG
jgi:hypothetical protein